MTMEELMIKRSQLPDCFNMGVRVGGRVPPDGVLDEIREFCTSPLVNICYIRIPPETTIDNLVEWAKELKRLKTKFILSPHFFPKGATKEEVARIAEAGGEYYFGTFVAGLGERGSRTASVTYKSHLHEHLEKEAVSSLADAFTDYIEDAREKTEEARDLFGGKISMTEATALLKYMYPAGLDFINSEVMNENLDFQLAYTRGAARGYKKNFWTNLLAHEWYGGLRNDDPLKYKRLKLAYDALYMAGSKGIFIESGEFSIISYGYNYDIDHEFCKAYRRIREDFTKSILDDERPSVWPLCKVGILHGNLDPYVGFGSSALMFHRSNEAWSVKDSERSWKLLDGIKQSAEWHDYTEFGPRTLSNAPAYGDYDIVPVESNLDVLCEYEYLMFLGWNTMTAEIYEKLVKYVEQGGKLLISAAHLNTNTKRDDAYRPIFGGRVSELLGCELSGSVRTDSAVQFIRGSSVDGVMYPCANTEAENCSLIDPLFVNGYVNLASVELCGAKAVAISNNSHSVSPDDPPILIENKIGKGTVFFIPSLDYPANSGMREFYRYIMKTLFTASHRTCDVQVIAGDKIRFNVYEGSDGKKKIYLLNTDFELPVASKIITAAGEVSVMLEPLERKAITV